MDELLVKYFKYNPLSGIIIWNLDNGKMKAGQLAGSLSKVDGYTRIGFKGKKYLAHRLAWFLYYNSWPSLLIDHIDGNRSNNIISNLRDISGSENNFNRHEEHGVGLYRNGKWRAYLNYDNHQYHIGYYLTKEEALEAHNAYKIRFVEKLFDKNKAGPTEFYGR